MPVTTEEFPGVVSSIEDPEKRGRIKVACAGLMGSEEEEVPMWIAPDYEWGWFVVPDPGEQVVVISESSAEDDEQFGQTSIGSMNLRWRGRIWGNSEAEEEALRRPIPDDFTKNNYGKRRGFATPQGHTFLFDDTESEPKISLTWVSGDPLKPDDQGRAFLTFDKQGVTMATEAHGDDDVQSMFFMNGENGEMLWVDSTGNSYGTTKDGIQVTQAADGESKCSIELNKSGIATILSAEGVVLSTKNVHLNAGEVLLGSGLATAIIEPAVLGNILINLLGTHTHPTGVGPSGPPAGGPVFFQAALAMEVKVK